MTLRTRRDVLRVLALGVVGGLPGCATGRSFQGRDRTPPAISHPSTSTTTTTATEPGDDNDTTQITFRQGTFRVHFSCRSFSVDVTPPDVQFFLHLQYRDTRTNERIRFIAGPFVARVEDPFGETSFVLLEAQIAVPGESTVAVYLPTRCHDGPLLDVPASRIKLVAYP